MTTDDEARPAGQGRNESRDANQDENREKATEQAGGKAPNQDGKRTGGAGPVFPESTLLVASWPDPVLDNLGHDPRSGYVERFWLPVLGPSCLLLLRRLAADLERQPDGYPIDSTQWARELGIGMRGGRHSPFWRAVERACRFGATRRHGDRLVVRRRLPPLSSRQVARLPASLRSDHEAWAQARLEQPRRATTLTRWTPTRERRGGPGEPSIDVEQDFPDAA